MELHKMHAEKEFLVLQIIELEQRLYHINNKIRAREKEASETILNGLKREELQTWYEAQIDYKQELMLSQQSQKGLELEIRELTIKAIAGK